jgi:hypothetical protein
VRQRPVASRPRRAAYGVSVRRPQRVPPPGITPPAPVGGRWPSAGTGRPGPARRPPPTGATPSCISTAVYVTAGRPACACPALFVTARGLRTVAPLTVLLCAVNLPASNNHETYRLCSSDIVPCPLDVRTSPPPQATPGRPFMSRLQRTFPALWLAFAMRRSQHMSGEVPGRSD